MSGNEYDEVEDDNPALDDPKVQDLLWEMELQVEGARSRARTQKERFRRVSYGAGAIVGIMIAVIVFIGILN